MMSEQPLEARLVHVAAPMPGGNGLLVLSSGHFPVSLEPLDAPVTY